MKIYFFEDGRSAIMDFANSADEPDCVKSFALADGKSTLVRRYALENNKLVDKYSGKTDEEVIATIQQEEDAKASELAAKLAPPTT